MIYKISLAILMPMLILSFFLAMLGVQQIQFGDSYYNFIRSLSYNFSRWEFELPSIPKIDKFSNSDIGDSDGILAFLKLIANFFVSIVNFAILGINVLISILNVFVKLIQFFISLIQTCKDFIGDVTRDSLVCV